jgi:ankyrin repeat protein
MACNCDNGQPEIVQYLCSKLPQGHPSLNQRDSNGRTPLLRLIKGFEPYGITQEGAAQCIEALIARGADVNLLDDDKKPLLAVAAARDDAAAVLTALAKHVNKDEIFDDSSDRYSALFTAVQMGYAGNVKALVLSGCNLDLKCTMAGQ